MADVLMNSYCVLVGVPKESILIASFSFLVRRKPNIHFSLTPLHIVTILSKLNLFYLNFQIQQRPNNVLVIGALPPDHRRECYNPLKTQFILLELSNTTKTK